ncbi:MAG: ATP-binding protein [Ginsengibacter sp.]
MKSSFYKKKYLSIFLGFIILSIAIEIIIAFETKATIGDSQKWVDRTQDVLNESNTVLLLSKEIQSNGRAYVITADTSFSNSVNAESVDVMKHIRRLSYLTFDNPFHTQLIDSLYKLLKERIVFSLTYISLRKDRGLIEASQLISMGKGIGISKKITQVISNIQQDEKLLLAFHKAGNSRSLQKFKTYFFVLCITLTLVVLILFLLISANSKLQNAVLAKSAEIDQKAKKFEVLLENSAEGIMLLDEDLNYIHKGYLAEKVTGFSQEDRTAREGISGVHPEDKVAFTEALRNALMDPARPVHCLYRVLHKNGYYVWIEAVITNRLNDQNVQAIVFNVRDVSLKVEIEKQKDDFLSMVSHELKTPVTSLKVLIHLLEHKSAATQDQDNELLLDKMKNQTEKLIRLINDLLDISKAGDNKLQFNSEFFRLDEVVEEIIDDLRRDNPTYVIQYTGFPEAEIFGDKDRIGQVIINLVQNAIKYSPKSKNIIASMYLEKSNVICAIKDFGMGIEEYEQEKIFERFYRAKNDDVLSFPGLGMGLYISSEIAKKHNGKLWVKSKAGEGSVFYFSIPLASSQQNANS